MSPLHQKPIPVDLCRPLVLQPSQVNEIGFAPLFKDNRVTDQVERVAAVVARQGGFQALVATIDALGIFLELEVAKSPGRRQQFPKLALRMLDLVRRRDRNLQETLVTSNAELIIFLLFDRAEVQTLPARIDVVMQLWILGVADACVLSEKAEDTCLYVQKPPPFH